MKIHELDNTATKNKKRKGRGISAGQGKTAGRGTKGQNSRTGGKRRPGFEGGQTPLFQRIPKKRGFTSKRIQTVGITLKQLGRVKGAKVDGKTLVEAGLITDEKTPVKIVATGTIDRKLALSGINVTKGAKEAIEKAGGSIN